jgi:hypothetical protein
MSLLSKFGQWVDGGVKIAGGILAGNTSQIQAGVTEATDVLGITHSTYNARLAVTETPVSPSLTNNLLTGVSSVPVVWWFFGGLILLFLFAYKKRTR